MEEADKARRHQVTWGEGVDAVEVPMEELDEAAKELLDVPRGKRIECFAVPRGRGQRQVGLGQGEKVEPHSEAGGKGAELGEEAEEDRESTAVGQLKSSQTFPLLV